MKLFLSSTGLPHAPELERLLDQPLVQTPAVVINNAFDPYPAWERWLRYRYVDRQLREAGLPAPTRVDLREFIGHPHQLRTALNDTRFIWASGGNTFWLRYAMHQSGFDTLVRELVDHGVVYGGESAGALVAGPSLQLVEHYDQPTAPQIIRDALGLTSFSVWPHWNDTALGIEPALAALPFEVVRLRDGQVVVVEDADRRIIG